MTLRFVAAITIALSAGPALANDDLRDLCFDRPGLGTPSCTLDQGHVAVEVGIVDWTRDTQAGVRTDSLIAGDTLVRVGLTPSLEAQVGWTAFGYVRQTDRVSRGSEGASRIGDVTLALRQNLRNPDGSGFSIALMPYASLPAGRVPVGAGDWGAGLVVPLAVDLGGVSLALTPRVEAAVNGSGKGRHLGYGTVVGLGFGVADRVSLTTEVSFYHDEDPAGRSTQALAGLALAWQASGDSQWDIGASLGLNRDSPDIELSIGYARRF
jgi:hypothetical protein